MKEYRTPEQKKAFYKTRAWSDVRAQALARDNYECQECRRLGRVTTKDERLEKHKQLDVDHVQEIETHPDLALDLENLRTLCIRCHNDKHDRTFRRKSFKWEHDERW